MTFDKFGLSTGILSAIADQGYTEPTPIQAKAIPVVLEGRDLLAGAQTGTGKTAGFTLPMLQRLSQIPKRKLKGRRRPVRALVLTPTRELAAQVSESVKTYGKNLYLKSAVIYGGVHINPQIRSLRAGVDIVVGTPGRVLDHVSRGSLDFSQIEMFILDEADRMLDMGFIHDIKKIMALMPENRQSLLFSATFSNDIKKLAQQLLNEPVSVQVATQNTAAELVQQRIHPVDRNRKRELLSHIITNGNLNQVLVFTRTRHGADRLVSHLERDGIRASAIHGGKSQNARTAALGKFKRGIVRTLVATDIAARGLDIDKLPHVVNFELPFEPENYVHRIGRTGRAGHEGAAVSLVCTDERRLLRDIERMLKTSIEREVIAGFEPDESIEPEPIRKGRTRSANNSRQGSQRPGKRGKFAKPANRSGKQTDGQNKSQSQGEDLFSRNSEQSPSNANKRPRRSNQSKGSKRASSNESRSWRSKNTKSKRKRPAHSSRPTFSDI